MENNNMKNKIIKKNVWEYLGIALLADKLTLQVKAFAQNKSTQRNSNQIKLKEKNKHKRKEKKRKTLRKRKRKRKTRRKRK